MRNNYYFSNNYACDGVPGCPEGKDELGCLETTPIDETSDAEALRVKTPEGKWQLVCLDGPDQVDFELANLACYQLGYWSAESFPAVPYRYGIDKNLLYLFGFDITCFEF